jgi:hypothetical protein
MQGKLKYQIENSNKLHNTNSKQCIRLGINYWLLEIVWLLEFVFWNLLCLEFRYWKLFAIWNLYFGIYRFGC